jgi:hypothetical protein
MVEYNDMVMMSFAKLMSRVSTCELYATQSFLAVSSAKPCCSFLLRFGTSALGMLGPKDTAYVELSRMMEALPYATLTVPLTPQVGPQLQEAQKMGVSPAAHHKCNKHCRATGLKLL